jgi:hypothetical protein
LTVVYTIDLPGSVAKSFTLDGKPLLKTATAPRTGYDGIHEFAARDPVRSRRHDPRRIWAGAVTVARYHAFADQLGPIEATVIAAAIEAARPNCGPIRRGTNTGATAPAPPAALCCDRFCRARGAGHPVPTEVIGDALADASIAASTAQR